jgi:hypothetical protein
LTRLQEKKFHGRPREGDSSLLSHLFLWHSETGKYIIGSSLTPKLQNEIYQVTFTSSLNKSEAP